MICTMMEVTYFHILFKSVTVSLCVCLVSTVCQFSKPLYSTSNTMATVWISLVMAGLESCVEQLSQSLGPPIWTCPPYMMLSYYLEIALQPPPCRFLCWIFIFPKTHALLFLDLLPYLKEEHHPKSSGDNFSYTSNV